MGDGQVPAEEPPKGEQRQGFHHQVTPEDVLAEKAKLEKNEALTMGDAVLTDGEISYDAFDTLKANENVKEVPHAEELPPNTMEASTRNRSGRINLRPTGTTNTELSDFVGETN